MWFPIGIYMFKVDNKSNKIRCETCFKLKDKYTTTTLPDDVLLFLLLSYFQLNHVYIVDRRCWRRLWKHELNLTSTYWCCSCSQKFCLIRWKTPVLECGEYCEIFRNNCFTEHLRTTAYESWRPSDLQL